MTSVNVNRCISLIDMDCLFVQVEQGLDPQFNGKPCVVVFTGLEKSCLAVNYEARAFGVKPTTLVEQALEMCPSLHIFQAPKLRGKSDVTRYRHASYKILEIMCQFTSCLNRENINEVYLDLTEEVQKRIESGYDHINPSDLPATFIAGYERQDFAADEESFQTTDKRTAIMKNFIKKLPSIQDPSFRLLVCAVIVEEIRHSIRMQMGIRCSAGIAHSQILAKLACDMNKPDRQTVIPVTVASKLLATIPISRVHYLAGKFGEKVKETFGVEHVGDLEKFTLSQLQEHFYGSTGLWLYNTARGVDSHSVIEQQFPLSIGCGKVFPGKSCLLTKSEVQHWLHHLVDELIERLKRELTENKRKAKLLTVNVKNSGNLISGMLPKSCVINVYDASKVYYDAFSLVQQFREEDLKDPDAWHPPVLSISISASKFQRKKSTLTLKDFFKSDKCAKTSTILKDATTESNKKLESKISNGDKKARGCLKKFFSNSDMNTGESSATSYKTIQQGDLICAIDIPVEVEDIKKCLVNSNPEAVDAEIKAITKSEESKTSNVESMSDANLKDEGKLTNDMHQQELILLPETDYATGDNVEEERKCNVPSKSSSFFKTHLSKNKLPGDSCMFSKLDDGDEGRAKDNRVVYQLPDEDTLNGDYESPEAFTMVAASNDIKEHLFSVCDRCGENILVWKTQEHADFHYAEDLANNSSQLISVCQSLRSSSTTKTKRKNLNKTPTADKKPKNTAKTIESYFQKQ